MDKIRISKPLQMAEEKYVCVNRLHRNVKYCNLSAPISFIFLHANKTIETIETKRPFADTQNLLCYGFIKSKPKPKPNIPL